jgi:hypothetical protein
MNLLLIRCLLVGALATLLACGGGGGGGSSAPPAAASSVPTLASVKPAQGPVGTPVVVTGTNLGDPATTATLNGVALSLTNQSGTQVSFTVPGAATSGNLVITTPGGSASKSFTVDVGFTLDLQVSKVELTQSTQTLDNTVPVVAGKPGLVRVFALANQTNTAAPSVEITLKNNGEVVSGYPKTVAAPTSSVPTVLDESVLSNSWNLVIPGTDLTTPTGSGYTITAVVDPAGDVAESDKTNNTTTVSLTGTTVPTFKTTIFPVVLSSGTGNITAANKDAWAARLAKMYPVASVDVVVGAAFTPSVSTLASDDSDSHWETLLNDLTAKHLADAASDRYYFGALNVSYASGVAGLGWVPGTSGSSFKYRTAIGWDKTGYHDGGNFPEVFAHETGHNMGRQHSPCGGAASPDPNYPYAGGLIGVWGYDSVLNQLYSPLTYEDIMGYCTPDWVSDYVYKSILAFRSGAGGFLTVEAEDVPLPQDQSVAQECLIVRGIVHASGQVELLPSFRTRALPSAVPSTGGFTLECQDQQGLPVYTTPLELMDLGCGLKGQDRHFVMALPLPSAVLDAIAGLHILQDGKLKTSLRSATAAARLTAVSPAVQRLEGDRVQLTWDATVHPAVLVRDTDSGEVIAILTGGSRTLGTLARRFDLVLSDGVSGPTHHLQMAD